MERVLAAKLVLVLVMSVVALGPSPKAALGYVPVLGLVLAAEVLETLPAVAAMASKLVIWLAVKVAVSETLPAVAATAPELALMLSK